MLGYVLGELKAPEIVISEILPEIRLDPYFEITSFVLSPLFEYVSSEKKILGAPSKWIRE